MHCPFSRPAFEGNASERNDGRAPLVVPLRCRAEQNNVSQVLEPSLLLIFSRVLPFADRRVRKLSKMVSPSGFGRNGQYGV